MNKKNKSAAGEKHRSFTDRMKDRFRFEFEKLLRHAYVNDPTQVINANGKITICSETKILSALDLLALRKRMTPNFKQSDLKGGEHQQSYKLGMREALSYYLQEIELVKIVYSGSGSKKWKFDLVICDYITDSEDWVSRNLQQFNNKWPMAEEKYKRRALDKLVGSTLIVATNNPEKLNSFFWDLNYLDQQQEFAREINSLSGSGVFFAEIDDDTGILQRWMVKRLITQNSNFMIEAYEKKYYQALSCWKGSEESFWSNSLGCSSDDSDRELLKIFENAKDRPVMFIFYDVNILGKHLSRILQCFCIKLQNIASCQNSKVRFSLLLVGESGWIQERNRSFILGSLPIIPLIKWAGVNLTCFNNWSLYCTHEGETMRSFYERTSGKSMDQICDSINLNSPYEVINTISCDVLQSKQGIAQLEKYWKLG
jgi:hypothetical protein